MLPPVFEPIDTLMQSGIQEGVFPGAVLLVSCKGKVVYHQACGHTDSFSQREITPDTFFDLASLTKPLATTLGVMKLTEAGMIDLDTPIGAVIDAFRSTDKAEITIQQLLNHTSGLPDYRPYYKEVLAESSGDRRAAIRKKLIAEPLTAPVGQQTVYSDLGFMILAWVIETASGRRMDRFVEEEVYLPLGLGDLFFIPLPSISSNKAFAATENCPWRQKVICGEVHDDNAWAAGGVEGHAGLFGTAGAVHRLLAELMAVYAGQKTSAVFTGELVRRFLGRRPEEKRALGFDVPDGQEASCGRYFSENTVGHLGFTGTSFWMDLEKQVIVILLTNRIHPMRDNVKIRKFRPKIHDAVMQAI